MSERDGLFQWVDGVWLRSLIEARLDANDRATTIAKASVDAHLASLNELRGMSKDQSDRCALKTDVEKVEDAIKELQLSRATLAGKASQMQVLIAYLISGISIIISVILSR